MKHKEKRHDIQHSLMDEWKDLCRWVDGQMEGKGQPD